MKLKHRATTVHTRRAFKIAVGARDDFSVVIATLEHDGLVGYGEASPSKRVTGEDAASVGHFLDWAAKELAALPPDGWSAFLDHVHEDICGNPAARCALDLALHDLAGKRRGEPARAIYDVPAGRIDTSMTVSLDAPDIMAEEAAGYQKLGYRCLKLKLGDAPLDAARVAAVRAACPHARLRVDANTGWSVADARTLLPALARAEVEFVEQPVPPARTAEFVEISRFSPIPVYADESVHDVHDVDRLHAAGFRGGVNVKLMKAGGLRPALAALRRARELGYATQLGCNIETSVGISGAAQLLALLDHADLDGNALLRDDPFVGAEPREGGIESPAEPGLGVRPR